MDFLSQTSTVYLKEWLSQKDIDDLRTYRIPDVAKIELLRQDGSLVGEINEGKLSLGQKCTAILALILAADELPVIIDQPEDDLDNEFVFKELVPLLRKVKEKRQIIIVSHNANIPVNGDAELIVPLEVKEGRGRQKIVDDVLAVGPLDSKAVQYSVEQIMEGSEEAFRRRSEKYGF